MKVINSKVLFYCHFPDKLLSVNRGSIIMRFYRFFLDLAEELTTGMAQGIVVNSEFTQSIFVENFPIIAKTKENDSKFLCCYPTHLPEVLYPAINLKVFEKSEGFKSLSINDMLKDQIDEKILKNAKIFTSLNRYERKKNINLAIKAFAKYLSTQQDKN